MATLMTFARLTVIIIALMLWSTVWVKAADVIDGHGTRYQKIATACWIAAHLIFITAFFTRAICYAG